MNEQKFLADMELIVSPQYSTERPSKEFGQLAASILLDAVRKDHAQASMLLEEYEKWRINEDARIANKDLLYDLRRTLQNADVRLMERRFARSWIYEMRYHYWRTRGVMYAELGDYYQAHRIESRHHDPDPPKGRGPKDYFLDNLVFDRSTKMFFSADSPNSDWWRELVGRHMFSRALVRTQYDYIFPIEDAVIQEACARCASTEEYTLGSR